MKKVLVVDDEFLVRLGLKTTIDWESHGYKIVGEASNGKEALEIFDTVNPDILLTDIKMPVMDGFKLIEEVRKKKKNLQIVILSHYDDFSFAQKAVRFGATQYILKSEMNEDNLIELLENLSEESKDMGKEASYGQAEREEYLKEQLFGRPANDDFRPSTLSAPVTNLFSDSYYIVMRGVCETSLLAEDSGDMLSKTVRTILGNAFNQSITVSSYYKNQFYFTTIALAEEKTKQGITAGILEHTKLLIRNIKQYFDVVVQIGISDPGKPERFPYMIGEAELARSSCFFTLNTISFFDASLGQNTEEVRISHSKLSSIINNDNREELSAYITQVFKELKKSGNYAVFKNALIDLLSIAKSICEYHKLEQVPSLLPAKFSYDNFLVMPFITQVETYIQDLYATIADAKINHEPVFSLAVRNAIAFIKNNYSRNISLTDAALAAEVSSSYLSLIFKQETGVNFSNYLTEYRIEQAKKMLATTSKKIYEIADEVGFSSPYYFSKVFKEMTGLACKEYKDRYGQAV